MKRLTLGLDVDGVLAAFSPAFIDIANRMFGLDLKPEDQTGWAHQSLGLSDEQADQVWEEINSTPNWWATLSKLPGTAALTDAASRHRLYFITHRNPTVVGLPIEEQTANWIRREFYIPNPTVITCEKKGTVARGLELDAFIDDKYANTRDVHSKSPLTKVFLHNAPYNTNPEMDVLVSQLRLIRANDVNDFIATVEGGHFGIREAA